MDMSYHAVEARIKDVIEAYHVSENPNRSAIARQFDVLLERLKSRLKGNPSKTAVRGLHNRRLTVDQEAALRLYYHKLSNADTPARLNSIKNEIDRLLRQDCDLANPPSSVGSM